MQGFIRDIHAIAFEFSDGLAHRIGLDAKLVSRHSMRRGFLTSAATQKKDLRRMADQARHQQLDTTRVYVDTANAFEDHPRQDLLSQPELGSDSDSEDFPPSAEPILYCPEGLTDDRQLERLSSDLKVGVVYQGLEPMGNWCRNGLYMLVIAAIFTFFGRNKRLGDRAVSELIKETIYSLKGHSLDYEHFSSHSLRRGFLTSASKNKPHVITGCAAASQAARHSDGLSS